MRTDYTTEASLGENKDRCLIHIEVSGGIVSEVEVIDAETKKDISGLIYGGPSWDQAWSAAERHMLAQPVTRTARRAIAANVASMCHDTPFAMVAA